MSCTAGDKLFHSATAEPRKAKLRRLVDICTRRSWMYLVDANSRPSELLRFRTTVCKTVCPMLSDRCLSCPVLSCMPPSVLCDVDALLWPNGRPSQQLLSSLLHIRHLCNAHIHKQLLKLTVALGLRFLYIFAFCFFALFAFVLLDLVSSVLSQETGWEERLQNELFFVEWDDKKQQSLANPQTDDCQT